jgi:hypothetical protein
MGEGRPSQIDRPDTVIWFADTIRAMPLRFAISGLYAVLDPLLRPSCEHGDNWKGIFLQARCHSLERKMEMKAKMLNTERLKYIVVGVVLAVGILFMMGTGPINSTVLDNGRFQISSYATQLGEGSGAVGAFIVDTVSGEVKTVYMRVYGEELPSKVVMNNLKRKYVSME